MYSLPEINHGLDQNQVDSRLKHFGFNQFESTSTVKPWQILLDQLKSPLVYVLVFAGILTLFLGDFIDSMVIGLVVAVNTLLGFYQEFKTSRALEALREYLKPNVIALRDGRRQTVPLKNIVPGDVVLLNTGESIPADGIIFSSQMMTVNEAILTGESLPVDKVATKLNKFRSLGEVTNSFDWDKQAKHWGFMGTAVRSGYGQMLVIKTGYNTRMGQIAHRLGQTSKETTPLQDQISQLARRLMYVLGLVTIILFVLGLYRGVSWLEMLMTSVAVAVAAIPEGLIVAMTVILALGMQRIFKRKALVRSLVAAETLGGVSVICADKTGTLTKGKMSVSQFSGDQTALIRAALLVGDDRDEESMAMSHWARSFLGKTKLDWTNLEKVDEIRTSFRRFKTIPFDSSYKYAVSLNHGPKQSYLSLAGAPEVVLDKVNLNSQERAEIESQLKQLAQTGHRLIAMAGSQVSGTKLTLDHKDLKNLDWYGFLAFNDPLRPGVVKTLSLARKAGVSIKVITGDYLETAVAVLTPAMGNLSSSSVITGVELAKLTETELLDRIGSIELFARTTPEQKLKIVKALKKSGQVVAMTGDGVNDAPALKAADIGIVVNEATDVSKQTADMVLLDSNIRSIIAAIREGRGIYDSIRKVAAYLISDSFQELVMIGIALVLGLPLPVTAAQILWINLVQDSFLGVALAFEKTETDLMKQPPRKASEGLINKSMLALVGKVVLVSNVGLVILYTWLLQRSVELVELQTMMFVAMATNSLFYIFSIRSLRRNIWQMDFWANKPLLAAVGFGFFLTWAAIYLAPLQLLLGTTSLQIWQLGILFSLGILTTIMIEIVKWLRNRYQS